MKLTGSHAAAWRVRSQHLDERAPAGSMLAVASRLCGLHAQLMSSAELTVWVRVEDLDRRAVQRALWEDRTLVKTWAMRGTLHLLPADELSLWHAALNGCGRYRGPAMWRRFGITLKQLDRITEAVAAALDGRVLTREELVQSVRQLTRSASLSAVIAKSSWGTILKPAAFNGHLCFGPSLGQRVRFTHPVSWLRAAGLPCDPTSAPAAITRRFLAAYGPATSRDLARWWGSGVSAARQWIASLGNEACAVDLDDEEAWMLAEDARAARELPTARSVRLLPAFDQYVVAQSRQAERLLPGDLRRRVYRPQGWISPVLLVNGRIAGTWRHQLKGSRVEVVVEPFVRTSAWIRRAAGFEAERLAAFLGGTLSFAWQR